jgi:hypothetical protein
LYYLFYIKKTDALAIGFFYYVTAINKIIELLHC